MTTEQIERARESAKRFHACWDDEYGGLGPAGEEPRLSDITDALDRLEWLERRYTSTIQQLEWAIPKGDDGDPDESEYGDLDRPSDLAQQILMHMRLP